MASVSHDVNDRFHGASEHARHDRLLVTRFGAGDAYPAELAEARQLVERCSECARLAREISLLRAATADLPVASRTRDFLLTERDAERLRVSAFDRWLRRLAAPGLAPLRPLAGVAVSVGLALAVVGVALPTPVGDTFTQEMPMPASGSADGAGRQPAASPAAPGEFTAGSQQTPVPITADDLHVVGLGDDVAQADTTRSLLVYGGLLIAVLSLGVLVLVIFARRRTTDRLLR
jgi:hypothetical protein